MTQEPMTGVDVLRAIQFVVTLFVVVVGAICVIAYLNPHDNIIIRFLRWLNGTSCTGLCAQ